MLRLLIILIVLGAGAAYLTKPSEEDVRNEARALIQDAIEAGDLEDVNHPALALVLLGCKTDTSACANVLMQGITLNYEDKTLFAEVQAEGYGRTATCYGAFTKLYCPERLLR